MQVHRRRDSRTAILTELLAFHLENDARIGEHRNGSPSSPGSSTKANGRTSSRTSCARPPIADRAPTLAGTALLALTATVPGQASAAGNTAYFTMRDITGSNFTVAITNPDTIREARDIVASGDRKIIIGRIVKSAAAYNAPWDFHYNPDTIQFADQGIEVCDATTPYVEDHLDEAGGAFLPGLYWCNWTGRLIAEVSR
ncbi:BP74-related protein [Actinacidiphila paucisporea]|uniref:BP74 N-terminal domain-containing protein n=1 Tax=Actinacidiphila paucisporea TaxID=310782 RepID=A0A1M6ZAZ2_9ACTN|nr:hypothetical protein [Actinacidiphila paucisporea]SHL27569.1 hypothetical protein SAMN05216499_103273 [Actinacidiphila paucisporea]